MSQYVNESCFKYRSYGKNRIDRYRRWKRNIHILMHLISLLMALLDKLYVMGHRTTVAFEQKGNIGQDYWYYNVLISGMIFRIYIYIFKTYMITFLVISDLPCEILLNYACIDNYARLTLPDSYQHIWTIRCP